jgi:hypothetical protein
MNRITISKPRGLGSENEKSREAPCHEKSLEVTLTHQNHPGKHSCAGPGNIPVYGKYRVL